MGIIPTSVGSTYGNNVGSSTTQGSSPRAWGALLLYGRSRGLRGIIPTSVGNTCGASRPCRWGRDHPHERGEHTVPVAPAGLLAGSSPRAWGTPRREGRAQPERGIIPTSVGNTSPRCPPSMRGGDHPHERGEHRRASARAAEGGGSSPRAWGTRWSRSDLRRGQGIIPTSVGNTSWQPNPRSSS